MFFHRILFSISLHLFGTPRLSEVIILTNLILKVNKFFKYFFSFFYFLKTPFGSFGTTSPTCVGADLHFAMGSVIYLVTVISAFLRV